VAYSKQNGVLTIPEEPFVRPHSFDALNPTKNSQTDNKSEDNFEKEDIHFNISDIPDIDEDDV
jgi:hypothetical protein